MWYLYTIYCTQRHLFIAKISATLHEADSGVLHLKPGQAVKVLAHNKTDLDQKYDKKKVAGIGNVPYLPGALLSLHQNYSCQDRVITWFRTAFSVHRGKLQVFNKIDYICIAGYTF